MQTHLTLEVLLCIHLAGCLGGEACEAENTCKRLEAAVGAGAGSLPAIVSLVHLHEPGRRLTVVLLNFW